MPEKTVIFRPWKATYDPLCQPLIYTASEVSTLTIPNFMSFNAKTQTFKIMTMKPHNEGIYHMTLSAQVI